MVLVEAGTLPDASELAGKSVKSFYIARTEVTWLEWKKERKRRQSHTFTFFRTIAPFFPQRSPQPESPIPNTAPWFNEPRPFLYPIGFIIAKIKIAEPFRV